MCDSNTIHECISSSMYVMSNDVLFGSDWLGNAIMLSRIHLSAAQHLLKKPNSRVGGVIRPLLECDIMPWIKLQTIDRFSIEKCSPVRDGFRNSSRFIQDVHIFTAK